MEIPTLKVEQYQQEPQAFARELGEVLERVGTFQIGINQVLLDKLYNEAVVVFEDYRRDFSHSDEYIEDRSRHHLSFSLHKTTLTSSATSLPHFPTFRDALYSFLTDFSKVKDSVTHSLKRYSSEYGPTYMEADLFRYKESKEPIFFNEHVDDTDGFATATREGLQGLIHGNWVSLQPESGYCIFIPGTTLAGASRGKVKALRHKVVIPGNVRRYSAVFS